MKVRLRLSFAYEPRCIKEVGRRKFLFQNMKSYLKLYSTTLTLNIVQQIIKTCKKNCLLIAKLLAFKIEYEILLSIIKFGTQKDKRVIFIVAKYCHILAISGYSTYIAHLW